MFQNLGWKSISAAALMAIAAGLELAGVDLSGLTSLTPSELLLAALSVFGLRSAIAKVS